jgi:perosamine synthetase
MKIPLIKPFITQEVKDKVCEVLDSGYLTEGPVTHEFEALVREYIGCKYAIAVTSCTTGLEMALRSLGIGAGDEVVVPDYTYPATATAVCLVGAKAVIVDVCRDTMLIDPEAVEAAITPRTKAIIPVSIFGNPLDYDVINALKAKHGLYVIEDAACSIGAAFRGRRVGTFADISVFSLHPRKFITTGEGGMVTTDNAAWAAWMESYKHFGMAVTADRRESVIFERIGTNLKLSNVQAAIGLVQMRHIDELLSERIQLANRYIELLREYPSVRIPATTPGGLHSRQSFCVYVNNRDQVMRAMREVEIEVQIGTYALSKHPAFSTGPLVETAGDMAGSIYAYDHCLALPLFHELTADEQHRVVSGLTREL